MARISIAPPSSLRRRMPLFAFDLALMLGAAGACGTSSDPPAGAGDVGGATSGDPDASMADTGAPPEDAGRDASRGDASDARLPPTDLPDPCRGTALPTDQHYVAPGLCARLVGRGQSRIRQITFAKNGDMFGVTVPGAIKRYRDVNGDGVFSPDPPETIEWATTGGYGNNCHIDELNGYLYAGTPYGVKRWKYDPAADKGVDGEDMLVGQPADHHGFHTVHVWEGWMYVQSGSAANAADDMAPAYDTQRSLVKRFELAKLAKGGRWVWATDGELVSVGLRNTVGFARSKAGKIFGVLNGLDNLSYRGVDVHIDNPGEEVLLLEKGRQYGYPFCFTAQRIVVGGKPVAPGTMLSNEGFTPGHDDAWCAANASQPTTFIQAHSAPLDITFFEGPRGVLPDRWQGGAFVSLHGSWNREPSTGYKVIWIPFDAVGNAPMPTSTADGVRFPYEVVLGGGNATTPKDGEWSWTLGAVKTSPRPVGVAVSPVDGALYVSSDEGGGIYRVGIKR